MDPEVAIAMGEERRLREHLELVLAEELKRREELEREQDELKQLITKLEQELSDYRYSQHDVSILQAQLNGGRRAAAQLKQQLAEVQAERDELKQQLEACQAEAATMRKILEKIAYSNIGYEAGVLAREALSTSAGADLLRELGALREVARLAESLVNDFPSSFDDLREALDKLEEANRE